MPRRAAIARYVHPQVSVATEGGSGTSVPDLSVEVDNFDVIAHPVGCGVADATPPPRLLAPRLEIGAGRHRGIGDHGPHRVMHAGADRVEQLVLAHLRQSAHRCRHSTMSQGLSGSPRRRRRRAPRRHPSDIGRPRRAVQPTLPRQPVSPLHCERRANGL
jgi:hypothetical protein